MSGSYPPLPIDPAARAYLGFERQASAAEMRAVDQAAVRRGVPAELLMENAGRASAAAVRRWMAAAGRGPEQPVLILAGPGNNGGDGCCVARTLAQQGYRPILLTGFPLGAGVRGAPELALHRELALEAASQAPFDVLPLGSGEPQGQGAAEVLERIEAFLRSETLVVDALFGTGLSRPIAAPFLGLLERLAASAAPILCLDLPSGLDADDGRLWGPPIRAVGTVSFGAWKRGLRCGEGPRLAGAVEIAEIGLPLPLIRRLPGL
jgi:NAD(P)H-hydrate epimerase